MKPKSAKILDGIRNMINTVNVILYPEATIPWIQFLMSTGASEVTKAMILKDGWKPVELHKGIILEIYLDPEKEWYDIIGTLREEGRVDIWIDRSNTYEFMASDEWAPTIVIVPKIK